MASITNGAVSYTHLDVYKRQVQAKPGGVDLKPSPWRPITLGGHRRRWALFLQGWWLKAQVAHELADPFTSDRSVLLAQGVICLLYTSRCV